MNQRIDNNLLAECLKAAMKVEYISNSRELKMYAYALYNAHMWARKSKIKEDHPNHQIDPLFSINSTNILLISKLQHYD